MADVVSERGRLNLKATIDGDSIDQPIQFDVREDEEQNVKLQETIALLTAAGYFRARIKGLPAFDKVVGGMVWCISLCNFDVDVDLLYSENSTIGQKIALTEKIVKVLPLLKCPQAIEPHQIQGLDFIHIFPVVQWLVKKAIEAKEEMGDQVQQFATYQFDSKHRLPEEEVRDKAIAKSVEVQQNLRRHTDPKRIYMKRPDVQFQDDSQRVHSTLLEYGWSGSSLTEQSQKSTDEKTETTKTSKELLSGLSEVSEQENRLSASNVVSLMDSDKIHEMAQKYAQESKGMAVNVTGTLTTDQLRGQIADAEAMLEQLTKEETEAKCRVEEERKMYEEVKEQEDQLDAEYARVADLEATVDKEMSERLRELMNEHDVTKQRERDFKEKCRQELAEMDAEIDRLSKPFQSQDDDQCTAAGERETAAEELQQWRLQLAETNRLMASLQRRIDQVPSQAELNQYQRRFLELYNQMASKHRETKQFFTLHNTLVDVKTYMRKEIDLLDDIYNVQALGTQEGYKLSFAQNLEKLLEGVKQSKSLVDRRHNEDKMKRDMLRDNYQEMLDKQRLYYKTVKDFQEECKTNEKLLQRLKDSGISVDE